MFVTFHINLSLLLVWRTTYWTVLRFTDLLARTTLRQRVRDHPIWWNLELGNGHEIAAWRLMHLPPRVYTNGDKHTIKLYVVINRFGWILLTMWSTNVLGMSYVAICRGCTFIYTRTSCSMDWNFPGGPMLEHAGYKRRSKQTRNSYLCTRTPERISQCLIFFGPFILLYNFFETQKRCEMVEMYKAIILYSVWYFIHAEIFQFGGTRRHSAGIQSVLLWTPQHSTRGTNPSASEQICWSAQAMRLI
jgi:hypothetical protein